MIGLIRQGCNKICLHTDNTLLWPAPSPDLSPTQHIWDHLGTRVGHPTSLNEQEARSILAMRCIGQGLESLKTFCAVMSLPNPVEQKSHDVINNKLSCVMKEVAEESMKMPAVEEYSSSPDNL
ncbi:hypothetical protein TNCV_1557801 [Trichonephila clavipes]|uniref:Uncharacterized protein n=1 Tax=Trichonephila clavipes TaxID=2585209 RepID=A0A8X6R732_TRICX|nr:hypothetical protein TNCV_1557801 [Trichonephila clavipes]